MTTLPEMYEVSFPSDEEEEEADADEYTYIDSDNEQDSTCQHQLSGMKRNASPSFSLNDVLTGPNKQSTSICSNCQEEVHYPVADCELIQRWNALTQDQSFGIIGMNAKYMLPAMKKRIQECSRHLHISPDQAFVKLQQEQWQLETCLLPQDVAGITYSMLDTELSAAPVQDNGGSVTVEDDTKLLDVDQAPDDQVCRICMESLDKLSENDKMSMACGHTFCNDCWNIFIQDMFDVSESDKCLQTTCPSQSCEAIVTDVQIRQVAPELLTEYENRKLHSFVEGNRATMRWCPGPDCANRVAVKCQDRLFHRNNNAVVASCGGCQTKFCFRCGQEPHDNRCCELDSPETSDGRPIKNCPECNIKIEKNGGCNRMRCKCGHAFCWICLEDMKDYNHFCGREGGVDADVAYALRRGARRIVVPAVSIDYVLEALKASGSDDQEIKNIFQKKSEMEHVVHYLNRYNAHEQGQRFAENRSTLLEGSSVDFAKASDLTSATDTDIFAAANKRLVASRRILKYTYCYAFYLPDEEREGMVSQRGLFQIHQERLERFTETLSRISEDAPTYEHREEIVNLIGIIDKCVEAIIGFSQDWNH